MVGLPGFPGCSVLLLVERCGVATNSGRLNRNDSAIKPAHTSTGPKQRQKVNVIYQRKLSPLDDPHLVESVPRAAAARGVDVMRIRGNRDRKWSVEFAPATRRRGRRWTPVRGVRGNNVDGVNSTFHFLQNPHHFPKAH